METFNTESLYASLDIPVHTMDYYIKPNNDAFNNDINNPNILNYQNISDLSIKNKIGNINATLKSLNIDIDWIGKVNLHNNPLIVDSLLSSTNSRNYLIDSLLQFIVDLIWKIKESNLDHYNLMENMKLLGNQKDNLTRQNRKIVNELEEVKREVKKLNYQNDIYKEKTERKEKSKIEEFNETKNENKKLNSAVNALKNEIKKKESEFYKLQEKYKKFLSAGRKEQNYGLSEIVNGEESKGLVQNSTKIFNKNMLQSCEEKVSQLSDRNAFLMNTLHQVKRFLESFLSKSHNFLSGKTDMDSDRLFMNVLSIKENTLSIHLLERNLLEKFNEQFIDGMNKFEEMVKTLIKTKSGSGKSVNLLKSPQKEDILKNFKKWTINHPNHLELNESVTRPNKGGSLSMHDNSQKCLPSSSQLRLNKWFDGINNVREIKYEYDENTVIKCDSENEEENTQLNI